MTNRGSILHSKDTVHRSLKTPDCYFHQLVEAVSDYAVFLLDSHGIVISWNKGAQRIKGYKAQEVIGQYFSIFFPTEAIKKDWPQYELAIAKAEGRFEEQGWRVRKDGSRFWADVTLTTIKDEKGKPNGFLKITWDLTGQKQAEEQRVQPAQEQAARIIADAAKEKAETASKAKDRILQVLSHELRTPLMPILFSSSMLLEDSNVPESVREHLFVIRKNATIEVRLIEDLIEVTKVEKGKLDLNLRATNVHDVLRTAIEICTPDLETKGLSLSVDLQAASHQLDADSDRLQQVFWNLLKNAIKYTEESGRLVVRSTNPESGLLRIEFTDAGRGMPQQLIPRIFEAFEQGEESEGLGLGPAISKAIVELHGGVILAHSEGLARGSTFVVELPLGQRFSLFGSR
jgi:PAS domain S-box-containing protein